MVASVMPAVVSINNTYTERVSYFGQTFTSEAQASGSGIIVGENDVELLIVTNYHVVEGADELSVIFADGSEIGASVKGMDIDMDLAVIAVPLENVLNSTLNPVSYTISG
ncbi:MAG: S1C family serine protease, partial [Lachnospiraceae bacterium]|nr:S1C family serine protease [Lachnospiraceae bacterium]